MIPRDLRVVTVLATAAVLAASAGVAPALNLEQATVVIAYRIEGQLDRMSASLKDNPKLGKYPVLELRLLTSPAEIGRLARLVSSERAASATPSVCFYPGLALSFVVDGSSRDVFVCLECDNMSGSKPGELVGLSKQGVEQFSNLYRQLFQGAKSEQAR